MYSIVDKKINKNKIYLKLDKKIYIELDILREEGFRHLRMFSDIMFLSSVYILINNQAHKVMADKIVNGNTKLSYTFSDYRIKPHTKKVIDDILRLYDFADRSLIIYFMESHFLNDVQKVIGNYSLNELINMIKDKNFYDNAYYKLFLGNTMISYKCLESGKWFEDFLETINNLRISIKKTHK